MNSVNLIGRLTRDPELRSALTAPTSEPFGSRSSARRSDGEDQGADYVDVTTFNRQAEVCAEYLGKGRRVAVQGRLQALRMEGRGRLASAEDRGDRQPGRLPRLAPRSGSGDDAGAARPEPAEAAA